MNYAAIWLRTFLVGFVVVSVLLVLTLFTPVPYGDLTRIGRLSDAEFGWQQPAPPAPPAESLKSSPLSDADIVVVGDSFSMTLYWQSTLVRAGYKVSTIYWGQVGYLCGDFSQWLQRAGFRGRLVIAESVERLLDERVRKSDSCATMGKKPPDVKAEPFIRPLVGVPDLGLNWSAKLTTGLITYRNMKAVYKSHTDLQFGDDTQVRFVPDGCKQFSHHLCERALFFKEDLTNGPLTAQTFEHMVSFTRSQPIPILWMVIPNKTTVYLDPSYSDTFLARFRPSGLGPDLFAFAQAARHQVRDLYFPNDTHFSMHGQYALGDIMLKEVQARLGVAKAP